MQTAEQRRFRSGDICMEAGWYEFDGYVDDAGGPQPGQAEVETALNAGDLFPAIQSTRRACFWKPFGRVVEDDHAEERRRSTAPADSISDERPWFSGTPAPRKRDTEHQLAPFPVGRSFGA
ncbi:MAG: hypothetical protein LC135_01145 [Phycisphaerae bacterium]|jgi:hypothetical protein|nr:hypothetical protein [Phycisphaerae bacterium]MCZ2398457.1 hypothetical protein [Phycisphaerae bacterium]NUQ48626.1 hypothetical protein [Phycisphaerae bacterium]